MILMRFCNKFGKTKIYRYWKIGQSSFQGGATRRRGDGEQTRA